MTLPPPSYNDDPTSFAYPTVHKRWPTILKGAIDDIAKYTEEHEEASKCGDIVTCNLQNLLQEFRTDAIVEPFSEPDIKIKPELRVYNEELNRLNDKKQVTWLTGPWLFLECYLYQLVDLWFKSTVHLKDFDVFENLKDGSFRSSSSGVLELCKRYESLAGQLDSSAADNETLKLLFFEFIDISLWGNATDLSLLAGNVSLLDIKSLQGAEVRKKNEEKIIVNNIKEAWANLLNGSNRRIDIVLDNSGFELFADLCLSLFVLDAGLADRVILHCKEIPWFVSDTMPKDFHNLLSQLTGPTFFQEIHASESSKRSIEFFASQVSRLVSKKQIIVQHHPFWTSCENFWSIPKHVDLYDDLLKSDLVIFKGDLNYRKLTGDLQWDKTTKFSVAIQDLATSNLPILALRTCKADVVVGLPAGLNETLIETYKSMGNEIGEFWTASGKWAVISFFKGSS